LARNYSLAEMPVFSPPGAVLALRNLPEGSVLGLATQQMGDLAFWVMPLVPESGLGRGRAVRTSTRVYDDDGLSIDYDVGEGEKFVWTEFSSEWTRGGGSEGAGAAPAADAKVGGVLGALGRTLFGAGAASDDAEAGADDNDVITFTIGAAEGNGYADFPSARLYTLRFVGALPPLSVTVDGEPAARDQAAAPDDAGEHAAWAPGALSWAFLGPSLSLWVRAGRPLDTAVPHTVVVTFPRGARLDDARLTQGLARIAARSLACKDEVDRHYGIIYPPDAQPVLRISAAATAISSAPDALSALRELSAIAGDVAAAADLVKGWKLPPGHEMEPTVKTMQAHCAGQLQDALIQLRGDNARPLAASDPRRAAAHSRIRFSSDIAKSAGSAPGQVSQYSGEGDDGGGVEANAEPTSSSHDDEL